MVWSGMTSVFPLSLARAAKGDSRPSPPFPPPPPLEEERERERERCVEKGRKGMERAGWRELDGAI